MKLSAASLTLFDPPQHANRTEAMVAAAANQTRAGEPLLALPNTPHECRPNPWQPTESALTFD